MGRGRPTTIETDAENNALFQELIVPKMKLIKSLVKNIVEKNKLDSDALDDFLQENLINIHRNIKSYDRSQSLNAWLCNVVYRRSYYIMKLEKLEFEVFRGGTVGVGFNERPEINIDMGINDRMWVALARCDKDLKEAFLLKHLHGFKYEEIGDIFSITPQAIKSRIHTCKKRLREDYLRAK